mgnify:FL=1
MSKTAQHTIEVWADWIGLGRATFMGTLSAARSRGKEIFSFEYDEGWLARAPAQSLDPSLGLYGGAQYAPSDRDNFRVFLDSCPDRWGRVLMTRREAQLARSEGRKERKLLESDFLLGVHDSHRMGALRFRATKDGPFLDDNQDMASPPWTSLRKLEQVSLALERDDSEDDPDYAQWLRMLIAPGGSLGGARPKASVLDDNGALWIAKFPSRRDDDDVGAWEGVIHELAKRVGIETATAQARKFGSDHHTFLAKRFDRNPDGSRVHFASAITLLQRSDGDDASSGASYLELAELIMKSGSQTDRDLEELWRRIVFSICVSNTDDHLRNHGFLLGPSGWALAPAYDMNPNPQGAGLKLNISETDNAQDLQLVREVAGFFRIQDARATAIIDGVAAAVRQWRAVAKKYGITRDEQARMAPAFEHAGW